YGKTPLPVALKISDGAGPFLPLWQARASGRGGVSSLTVLCLGLRATDGKPLPGAFSLWVMKWARRTGVSSMARRLGVGARLKSRIKTNPRKNSRKQHCGTTRRYGARLAKLEARR